MGRDALIPTLWENIVIVFRGQCARSECDGWRRGLTGRKYSQQHLQTPGQTVCLGLIMGSLDHHRHRTEALISATSHWLPPPLVFVSLCSAACIDRCPARDWPSLMAVCHASDSHHFLSSKTSRARRRRGISDACSALPQARRRSKGPGGPPPPRYQAPPPPRRARLHSGRVKPVVEIWQRLFCFHDGFQPQSVNNAAPTSPMQDGHVTRPCFPHRPEPHAAAGAAAALHGKC